MKTGREERWVANSVNTLEAGITVRRRNFLINCTQNSYTDKKQRKNLREPNSQCVCVCVCVCV